MSDVKDDDTTILEADDPSDGEMDSVLYGGDYYDESQEGEQVYMPCSETRANMCVGDVRLPRLE